MKLVVQPGLQRRRPKSQPPSRRLLPRECAWSVTPRRVNWAEVQPSSSLPLNLVSTGPEQIPVVRNADGSVTATLPESTMTHAIATRNADGTISIQEVIPAHVKEAKPKKEGQK